MYGNGLFIIANTIMRKMIQIITRNLLNPYHHRHPATAGTHYLSREIISVDRLAIAKNRADDIN
ncbi:hypothetical protein BSQ40_11455 [Serratia fonticola]|nr:hypothetical protein BSQ40_11455 [Serratia fonticola]